MTSIPAESTEDQRRKSDAAGAERLRIQESAAAEQLRKESSAVAERLRLKDHDEDEIRRRESH